MKDYWGILRAHPHPARFVAARILMATGASRFLVIAQHGYRLRFHRANIASQRWIDPSARNEAAVFMQEYLCPGDHVVDVGANIGETVLAASLLAGAEGHVVGIEAHPRTFAFLVENVALNRAANVSLIQSAVGAARASASFSDERRDDMNRVGEGSLDIAMDRLDALVEGAHPVALLKIDVEGYEKPVLEGATQILRRTACVYFEVSELHFRRYGYRARVVLELLEGAGFGVYAIGARALRRIAPDYEAGHAENLVALRDAAEFTRRTGWPVHEPCTPKGSGAATWVFLGDSIVEGVGRDRASFVTGFVERMREAAARCEGPFRAVSYVRQVHGAPGEGELVVANLAAEATTARDDLRALPQLLAIAPQRVFIQRGALESVLRPACLASSEWPAWVPRSWHVPAGMDPRVHFSQAWWRFAKQRVIDWLKQRARARLLARDEPRPLETPDAIVEALGALVAGLRSAGVEVVIMGLLPIDERTFPGSAAHFAKVNARLRELAAQAGVPFMDWASLVGPPDFARDFLRDGFHPAPGGAERFGAALAERVLSEGLR